MNIALVVSIYCSSSFDSFLQHSALVKKTPTCWTAYKFFVTTLSKNSKDESDSFVDNQTTYQR